MAGFLARHLQAKSVPAFAAATLAVIGIEVLVGWAFGITRMTTILPGLISMKPNTATGFLLTTVALYLAYTGKYKPIQAICASTIVLLGVVTLTEYVFRINVGIDQLLFYDSVQFPFPGRMAPITAVNFLLTGVMLFPFRFRTAEAIRDLLALVVCFGSTFAMVGYLYGVPLLYGSVRYTAMAIHTGFGFLVLSLGFLFIQKENGFGRIFQAKTAGGVVVRRLVPPAILIPIVLGAVFNRFNFGQLRLGIAFIVLSNVLLVVASIWTLARVLDTSEIERGRAEQASEIDALTGIHNRRYFDQRLQEEILRCVRYSGTSCLLLFDVDHFKSLNDRFGHQSGDEVLIAIAQACARNVRATDVICRYGGEEFAIIAPETAGKDAMVLARKIRIMVELLRFEKAPTAVTISVGVAPIGRAAPSPELAIAAADQALYYAKQLGRNRECLYGESKPDLLHTVRAVFAAKHH